MKPRLLICNDDGIHAPGIYALWDALKDFADIVIAAPAHNQSSKGASNTVYDEVHAEKVEWEQNVEAWKIYGTPVDAVKIGLEKFFTSPPDFVISGINNGGNHAKNVIYSGTIANAIHASFHGVPAIAFSHIFEEDDAKNPIYSHAKPYIPNIISHFIEHPIPKNIVLSVNFPYREDGNFKGIRLAKQGSSYWRQSVEEITSDNHKRIFKHLGTWMQEEEDEESDTHLLHQGFITVTPIRAHDLTDEVFYRHHQDKLASLEESLSRHLTGVKNPSGESP